MNTQPGDFVVCTDRRRLEELSGVWRHAGHVATSAATIALIAPQADDPRTRCSIEYDLGQVTMSMMLAAADLGIGSGHASVMDQDMAQRILGHPEDRYCAYLIALGYPADRPLAPIRNSNRRPFDDVVHRGRW
jgi:nitroreductase